MIADAEGQHRRCRHAGEARWWRDGDEHGVEGVDSRAAVLFVVVLDGCAKRVFEDLSQDVLKMDRSVSGRGEEVYTLRREKASHSRERGIGVAVDDDRRTGTQGSFT